MTAIQLMIPANRNGIHWMTFTYFVRRLGFEPSFHLTTGTFNHFVKDLIRTPPERRSSGAPAETEAPRNLLSPCRFRHQRRTFQTYRDLLLLVNPEPLILLVLF